MPAPLIAAIGSAVGSFVGSVGAHTVGAIVHNLVRDAVYEFNAGHPTLWPEPPEILNCYYRGQINDNQLAYALQFHAIDYNGKDWQNQSQKYWWHVVDSGKPGLDPRTARFCYWAKAWGQPSYLDLARAFNSAGEPIYDSATKRLRWHIRRHGLFEADVVWDYLTHGEPLSLGEYQVARQRGIIDENEYSNCLYGIGISNSRERQIAKNLLQEIPGPSEIVHFVLRHGFEPSVIRANRLNEEFPTSARDWLEKLGFNYTFQVTDPFTSEVADTTWADMYWQTHWVPISPGQAYTMLQRIREDNIDEWRRTFPGLNAFTLDDVRRWLRINDYPPGIRDYLAAISYNPIGRIDIRRAYQTETINQNELPGLYQNIGYSPTDAQKLADFTVAYENQRKFKIVRKDTQSKLKQAYVAGVLTDQDLLRQLYRLQLESPTDVAAFDDQGPDIQLRRANDTPGVVTAVVSIKLEVQLDRVKTMTKLIRRRVLGGFLSGTDAEAELRILGVTQAKIDELITGWRYELQNPRKDLTVAQLLGLASKGIITVEEALIRLVNLGHSESDSRKILARAQIDLALTSARDALAQARTAAERQKALIAQQREAQAAQRSAQQQLAKYGSPAKLVYWFQHRLIELPELQRRLRQILSRPEDLAKWEVDAIEKRKTQDEKNTKSGAKAASTPASTSSTATVTNPPAGKPVQSSGVPAGGQVG